MSRSAESSSGAGGEAAGVQTELTVWIDGSCYPNPGRGGWGWTTLLGEEGFGGRDQTTNQAMELTAAIEAIKALALPGRCLLLISDSEYVVLGATRWMHKWARQNWKRNGSQNPAKSGVKNLELWRELHRLMTLGQPIRFEWVRGHDGNLGNEEADRLAAKGSGLSAAEILKAEYRIAQFKLWRQKPSGTAWTRL